MNEIEKLIELTRKDDGREKSAAQLFTAALWIQIAAVLVLMLLSFDRVLPRFGQGDLITHRIDKLMLVDYDTETVFAELPPDSILPNKLTWRFETPTSKVDSARERVLATTSMGNLLPQLHSHPESSRCVPGLLHPAIASSRHSQHFHG